MALYSTGMRCSGLVRLRVEDIDSERMVFHSRKGMGGKDRDVPLCPKLLETLREYWRWKKPKIWLFPGEPRGNDQHLTNEAIWYACAEAARHAGLKKRVTFDGERVTFRWKDYAQGGKHRTMTLLGTEFLRRFFLHVLPKRFVRIR